MKILFRNVNVFETAFLYLVCKEEGMAGTNRPQEYNDVGPLEARIRDGYASLPASERRIADLILEFPGDMAAYSATELAELAKSSKAAVTRLTRRLGYTSYEEARRSARESRDWGSPLYRLSHERDESLPTDSKLKRHLDTDIANMIATFDGLDNHVIEDIVEAIVAARRVWLIGFRNSAFLASYAKWQLIQVRDDVAVLPSGGETLAEYLASMSSKDLIIVIGFRRRVQRLRRFMETAAELGLPMVYFTDPSVRETTSLARWTVLVNVSGVDVFDNYSAALSLIHYVSAEVVAKTGAPGRERLKSIETLHDQVSDFG
ncbi:MAG: MurR/RpiR family transcriptional regulator [Rhodobacteraceae bacterium]|nr:MurR/RpiR family transcriptional regulator [Paracoccaceae bacterium]